MEEKHQTGMKDLLKALKQTMPIDEAENKRRIAERERLEKLKEENIIEGRIVTIQESYPNSPHWDIYILVDRQFEECIKMGTILAQYPNDIHKQVYGLVITSIGQADEFFANYLSDGDLVLRCHWSPEYDIDEGLNIEELKIGNITFNYLGKERRVSHA